MPLTGWQNGDVARAAGDRQRGILKGSSTCVIVKMSGNYVAAGENVRFYNEGAIVSEQASKMDYSC